MARPRKEEARVVTSADVGSDSLDESGNPLTSMTLAVVGEYPEGYEEYPAEWKAAYDHAAGRNNPVKAAIGWADAHMQDNPDGSPA